MQQLAQVSQEAAKMVEGMNVGEISKPFTMINAKGKEICAIVKLKTRLNGHKATITEDYQRLKGIVMEKRAVPVCGFAIKPWLLRVSLS